MAVSISISVTQNSQSIANNTSNVTVKVTAKWTNGSYNLLDKSGWLKIDGTPYTFTSPFNTERSTSGSVTLFSKTVNISHNTNGSKTLSCSASYTSGVSSGTVTASASKTLTTIPRVSKLSTGTGTLGTSQTLTITRQSSSFTHSIKAVCGSASVYIKADGSTSTSEVKHSDCSIPFTPPLAWASQNTVATTVLVKFTVKTYNGSSSIGEASHSITCSIPASVKPSCSVTVTDPTGYYDTYGGYVQGRSKFKVVVTPTLAYGSEITGYKVYANGTNYTKATVTTGVLSAYGDVLVSANVTDERGRTSETLKRNIPVLAYFKPQIHSFCVRRCNADGTANDKGAYAQITFTSSTAYLNGGNNISYVLKYKKSVDANYMTVSLTDFDGQYSQYNSTYIFPADTGYSYDIKLEITDDFETTIKTTSVSTGFTLMHWLASGLGMAIGKIAELAGVLDIGFKTRFSGGILHPVLEPETDLNEVLIPNTYVGANLSNYNYKNCPISSGTFSLEVIGCGEAGQVKQRLTICNKTKSRVLERFYYQSTWGEWFCVSDYGNTLLWSGGMYMQASHTISLSEAITKQPSGIVLVFSRYSDSTVQNYHWQTEFIPKWFVENDGGGGYTVLLSDDASFSLIASKYLYIDDTEIRGHANNVASGTGACGVTYNNKGYVLRAVIGV